MKRNTQRLKEGEHLKKNKLYELSENKRTAVFREEHEDSIPELVEIEFQIPQCGKAIAANEYRNKDYKDSKAADILCILVDESQKKISTHVYDIKRTMTGYDETKTLEELRREVIRRMQDFILQIRDSLIHKEGLLALYQHEGYTEIVTPGLITREFETKKLERLQEKLKSVLDEPAEKHGAVGQKYYIATMSLRKELEMIEHFEKKKIKVLNQMYDLQVILLEFSEEKDAYYQKIVLGEQKVC